MLEKICIPIQRELRLVEEAVACEINTDIDTVSAIAKYVIKNGGKRIRPVLFLLTSKITGLNLNTLPQLAAALEMLHTASLLHDDIVDDAKIRRGMPSANSKWGNQVSVLVGDMLLCRASNIVVREQNPRLMDVVIDALTKTIEGELSEIAHQNDISIDKDTYMDIISGKTAALFKLATRAPAIMAGLDSTYEEALGKFGLSIGLAFQLTDDALDYVANENLFGKSAGTDLYEGKITYPLIVALNHARPEERQLIHNAIIAGQSTTDKFLQVKDIVKRYGAIEATLDLAKSYADTAKEELSIFKSSIERDSLIKLADYVVERNE